MKEAFEMGARVENPCALEQLRRFVCDQPQEDDALIDIIYAFLAEQKAHDEATEYYEQIRKEYNKATDREARLLRRIDQARGALERSDFNTCLAILADKTEGLGA